jgi:acrylyl-CoA reductase (NADPH)
MTFRALLLTQADGKTQAEVAQIVTRPGCPRMAMLVAVDYSMINFKDGLATTDARRWCASGRWWPASTAPARCSIQTIQRWKTGDRVVLNGYGVGETHWGCLAQRAKLKGDWLSEAARCIHHHGEQDGIGTAATAMSVLALERGGVNGRVRPGDGEVLVTAAGGWSVAIALPVEARLSRDGIDGRPGKQISCAAGRCRCDRPRRTGAWQASCRRTLGGRGGFGSHTLVNACAQAPWRRGHGVGWRRAWISRPRWRRSSCAA